MTLHYDPFTGNAYRFEANVIPPAYWQALEELPGCELHWKEGETWREQPGEVWVELETGKAARVEASSSPGDGWIRLNLLSAAPEYATPSNIYINRETRTFCNFPAYQKPSSDWEFIGTPPREFGLRLDLDPNSIDLWFPKNRPAAPKVMIVSKLYFNPNTKEWKFSTFPPGDGFFEIKPARPPKTKSPVEVYLDPQTGKGHAIVEGFGQEPGEGWVKVKPPLNVDPGFPEKLITKRPPDRTVVDPRTGNSLSIGAYDKAPEGYVDLTIYPLP